jgi:hypothetical protein
MTNGSFLMRTQQRADIPLTLHPLNDRRRTWPRELTCKVLVVEAMGLEPTNLLTASQALYQLSYAPSGGGPR